MPRRETLMFMILIFIVICFNSLNSKKYETRAGSNIYRNLGKLRSMKKLKRGLHEEKFCVGQRCPEDFNENAYSIEPFNCLVIVSLIGLAILLARGGRAETYDPSAFRHAVHSTSIRRCSPSLSPSPIPRRPPFVRSVSEYSCDRGSIVDDDLSSVKPPPTSPESRASFSDVSPSSSFDLFPMEPPRRWRGNSMLHLASSPEVVPRN